MRSAFSPSLELSSAKPSHFLLIFNQIRHFPLSFSFRFRYSFRISSFFNTLASNQSIIVLQSNQFYFQFSYLKTPFTNSNVWIFSLLFSPNDFPFKFYYFPFGFCFWFFFQSIFICCIPFFFFFVHTLSVLFSSFLLSKQ